MNKIILNNSGINSNLDEKIKFDYTNDLINKLKIKVYKNSKLELKITEIEELKLNIEIEIMDNVKFEMFEIKNNIKTKILNKYNLGNKSKLNLIKTYDLDSINEKDVINLNGEQSDCNLIIKTVSKNLEKYDIVVNHNYKNTYSNVITNGLNISGNLYFTISTLIPNGNKNCIANQNNRIINLTEKECIIKPNLLIEEVDVTANHSALIGGFKNEELFYIQRLGIPKQQAYKLLIEGFLKSKLNDKMASNFKKYWR